MILEHEPVASEKAINYNMKKVPSKKEKGMYMTEQEKKELAAKVQAEKNEKYLRDMNNLSSLDKLLQAAEDYQNGIRKEVWPTGFDHLDYELDGGFHGAQLVICGAISSLGKTTACLQMASQMAEQGKDVLIFSLEMSREELNAKTVSRNSHILTEEAILNGASLKEVRTRFTTNEIMKGDVNLDNPVSREFFEKAVEKAKKAAEHTFIYVGNNDVSIDKVAEIVNQHIAATGKKPAVFLDYLQIMNPSKEAVEKRYDVRRSTNDDITKLKVLAREFDIPVVVISAFNRASYTDPVSMSSFRESSGIEYSADVLIGLQYKGMEYFTENDSSKETDAKHNARVLALFEKMQAIARDGQSQHIELKLLKNRNGSRTTLEFDFTPKYNYFEMHGEPTNLTKTDFIRSSNPKKSKRL